MQAFIATPSATYSYAVGGPGAGGTAGTSGFAGGDGGEGIIVVEEFYALAAPSIFNTILAAGNNISLSTVLTTTTISVTPAVALQATDPTNTIPTAAFADMTGFNSVAVDTNSAFNNTTGEYTIPVTGLYTVSANLAVNAIFTTGDNIQIKVQQDTGGGYVDITNSLTKGQTGTNTLACALAGTIISCTVGDLIKFQMDCDAAGGSYVTPTYNWISIHLIK